MNTKVCYGILITLVLTTGSLWGQGKKSSLSSENVAHVYNPTAPVQLDARVAMSDGQEATVFLRVTSRLSDETPSLRYAVHSDYLVSSVLDSGQVATSQLVKQEDQRFYYRFTLSVTDESHFLFITVVPSAAQPNERYRFDITLNSEQNFPLTDLLLMRPDEDIPIFQDYLSVSDPFRLVSYYGNDSTVFLYYYSHNFEPNPPPMSTGGSEAQPGLTIDSLFAVPLNKVQRLEQRGLYFVQLDTTSLYGTSFRIEDQYYPRLARVETIVPTLRYISTSDEMSKLATAEVPKRSLDDYWMKVARSQERAKDIIRSYFRQVTQANQLFTSYKEGWKTGPGMVYTLYGPPDAVYRDADKETWIYNENRNLVDLSFTFVKVKNIFTHQYYNLVRDEAYKRFWYRNVDLWRKGRKEI